MSSEDIIQIHLNVSIDMEAIAFPLLVSSAGKLTQL